MTDNGPRRSPDIFVIGTGIVAVRQLTHEVERALAGVNEILFLDHGLGVKEHFETICSVVTDLYPTSYREDEQRVRAYDRMTAAVLTAALDHPPVAFAVYGHPKIYVYPTIQISEAAKLLGLRVEVLPGISSLDTILIDLGLDPGIDGLQMYEATDLLLRDRPLQPDVPCLLWQIGPIESSLYSRRRSSPDRFLRLQLHLLRFYPEAHEVTAVQSSGHPLVGPEVTKCAIRDLPEVLPHVSPVATLYVPALARRTVANDELVDALTSVAHLESITASPSDHAQDGR